MKKRIIGLLAAVTMLAGMSVGAAETEKAERNYAPEEGKGWMAVEINGEEVEFEYTGSTKGMTGTTYNFKADRCVFTVHICVCGAVHGSDALQRQIVVHHGEHTFFHFSAVPCIDDNLLTAWKHCKQRSPAQSFQALRRSAG